MKIWDLMMLYLVLKLTSTSLEKVKKFFTVDIHFKPKKEASKTSHNSWQIISITVVFAEIQNSFS